MANALRVGRQPSESATKRRWSRVALALLLLGPLGPGLLAGCGGGGGSSSLFNDPIGIAVDATGRIYVADHNGHRIVRFDDMTGANLTPFGTYGTDTDQFVNPWGMALDSIGRIYVSDVDDVLPPNNKYTRLVRIDDITGSGWTTYGATGSDPGNFYFPNLIAVDQTTSQIYIPDFANNRIVRIDDMSGTNWISFSGPLLPPDTFAGPNAIALDSFERIYVTDWNHNRIVRMDDMTGTNWTTFGGPGNSTNQFNGPNAIAIDANNNIYITDWFNNRIIQMTTDMQGTGWTVYPPVNTPTPTTQLLSYPAGIAIAGGKIYIADEGKNRIVRMDDMTGKNFTTFP